VPLGVLGGEKAERCKMDEGIKRPTLCPLRLFPLCALWLKKSEVGSQESEVSMLNLSPATRLCLGGEKA